MCSGTPFRTLTYCFVLIVFKVGVTGSTFWNLFWAVLLDCIHVNIFRPGRSLGLKFPMIVRTIVCTSVI